MKSRNYSNAVCDSQYSDSLENQFKAEQRRHTFVQMVFEKHLDLIINTARYALAKHKSEDWAVEPMDIASEVMLLVFKHADSLAQEGSATLKWRLKKLVETHVWRYHVKKRKRRYELVATFRISLCSRGCETLSQMELDSMRFDELEPDHCNASTVGDDEDKANRRQKRKHRKKSA